MILCSDDERRSHPSGFMSRISFQICLCLFHFIFFVYFEFFFQLLLNTFTYLGKCYAKALIVVKFVNVFGKRVSAPVRLPLIMFFDLFRWSMEILHWIADGVKQPFFSIL